MNKKWPFAFKFACEGHSNIDATRHLLDHLASLCTLRCDLQKFSLILKSHFIKSILASKLADWIDWVDIGLKRMLYPIRIFRSVLYT